jgi:hypothetical protein
MVWSSRAWIAIARHHGLHAAGIAHVEGLTVKDPTDQIRQSAKLSAMR